MLLDSLLIYFLFQGGSTASPSNFTSAVPSTSTLPVNSSARNTGCSGSCSSSRRNQFHYQGSSSTSLPTSRDASLSPPADRGTSTVDEQLAEALREPDNALGSYEGGSRAILKIPSPSNYTYASQLERSSVHSACTNTGYVGTYDNVADARLNVARVAEEEVRSRHQQNCACEGACGCANDSVGNRSSEDNPPSVRSRVLKLLRSNGNVKNVPSPNLDSKSTSTNCTNTHASMGNSSYQKDFSLTRNASVESKDRKKSRNYRSYQKSQDDSNIATETTSILGAATSTNNIDRFARVPLAATRNYSSCDIESLYESIRILDEFLSKRTISTDTFGDSKRRKVIPVRLANKFEQRSEDDDAAYCTPMSMSRRESKEDERKN